MDSLFEEHMNEGDMLKDLIELLHDLSVSASVRKEAKKEIVKKIVKRHALPWYEGEIEGPKTDHKRLNAYVAKVKKIIPKAIKLRHRPHDLSAYWMEQITEIDEGYAPSKSDIFTDKLMRELVNIWTYTSSHKGRAQWAMAKAIRNQMKKHASVLERTQSDFEKAALDRALKSRAERSE